MKNRKITQKKEQSRELFIQLIKKRNADEQSILKKLYEKILKDIQWKF